MSEDATVEEWREIPGHEGYEISNRGNVRSWKPWRGSTLDLPRTMKVSPKGRVQLGLHGGSWSVDLLMAQIWGREPAPEESGVPLQWRRIMLSERQHALLCHVLESSLRDGYVGDPTRKLLNCIRNAKRVLWSDPIPPGDFA